jgi:enamine deaminase RidA (YjgF/YER057c/UK114 family)
LAEVSPIPVWRRRGNPDRFGGNLPLRQFAPPFPARTTIGVASLPLGARLEIGLIAARRR